jgi:hypothetical protein
MDALRHQLMMATDRSDHLEAELAAFHTATDASTELTGHPALSVGEPAAPDSTEISS